MNILIFAREKSRSSMRIQPLHKEKILQIHSEIHLVVTDLPTRTQLKKAQILIPVLPLKNVPLDQMANLQWIHVTSAGMNKLPELIKQSNIIITNSSGVHPIPIAEQVFGYLLMFARSLHQTYRYQVQHQQWMPGKKVLPVFELHGKTIGIVGLGRIGSQIAKLAKAFDMKVLAIVADTARPRQYVDQLWSLDQLNRLLAASDFVINCLPGTEQTKAVYTLEQFKQMKSSGIFVNIGRGSSVKEADLVQALKDRTIAGAGLDVFEKEPLANSSPLWTLEDVIITPHTSGKTPYYMDRVIDIFCQNLVAYFNKETLPNRVDFARGY